MRRRLLTAVCIAVMIGLALGVNSTHAGQTMQTVPTEGSTPTRAAGATSTTAAQPTSRSATAQPGAATPTQGVTPSQATLPTSTTLPGETAAPAVQATQAGQTALPAETMASNPPQFTATAGQSFTFLPSVGTNTASTDWVKRIYILAFGIGLLVAVGIIVLLVILRAVRKRSTPVNKDIH